MYLSAFRAHWRPLALVAAYLAVNAPFVPLGLNVHDEGSMAYVAWRLAEGETLYRDISVPVTPGTYYVLSWVFRLFGPQLVLGRLWVLLVGLGTCLLIYWVGTTLAQNCSPAEHEQLPSPVTRYLSLGFLAALCYCFWSTAHFASPRPAYEANALALLSLGLVIRYLLGGSRRSLVGAGLAAGASFLFKQNIGFAVPAALMATVLIQAVWTILVRLISQSNVPSHDARIAAFALTTAHLFFLTGRYGPAAAIFALWAADWLLGHAMTRAGADAGSKPPFRAVAVFVLLAAAPLALVALGMAGAGCLGDMLWNVFGFATRFVDVGSSRQADIAGFMGERLVNFAYAVVAVYASRQCLAFWRQSRAFEGACFAVMGLLTVLAKMYHIQAEAMSLVTLWHFYDRTLLVAFAYTVALLISLWLVWRGLALFQRGERLGGGYLLALAAILVANKLSPVAEGEVARAIMESRPTNPWGLLMLVYALAAFWALRAAFSQNRIAPAFAVLACFAASCATLLPSQTFDHVVLAAPPAFCVLALVFACSRRGAVNLLVVALLAALGLTAALDNKSQYWAYGPAAQQDTPLRSPRARLVRGEARIVGETEAVAECVRSLTSPKDSVFVCSGNVAIYFLAERKFFSTQFQTNKYPVPEVKSVFLKDLQRARVAVLVTKPLTTADISETEEAQRYVATHFSLAKQFEHYAVYLRQQTNPE